MFSRGVWNKTHEDRSRSEQWQCRQNEFSLIVTVIANARCAQFGRLDIALIEIVHSRSGENRKFHGDFAFAATELPTQ